MRLWQQEWVKLQREKQAAELLAKVGRLEPNCPLKVRTAGGVSPEGNGVYDML